MEIDSYTHDEGGGSNKYKSVDTPKKPYVNEAYARLVEEYKDKPKGENFIIAALRALVSKN